MPPDAPQQAHNKLRRVFRRADVDRNSLVDKAEFVAACEALNLQVRGGLSASFHAQ